MKKWGTVMFVLGLCAAVVGAQETEWMAYASGVPWASQFDSTGTLLNTIYVPGFSDATADLIETSSLMISPSQRYVLYAASTGEASHMDSLEHDYQESIVIYDPTTQEVVFKADLPTYSYSGIYAIDEEAGQVAALVANTTLRSKEEGIRYFELTNFEVLVFDYTAGSTTPIASLSDEPFLKERYGTSGEIHAFKDGKVTFSLTDYQGDFPSHEAYTWDTSTDTLTEEARYGVTSDVLLTTGDAVRTWSSQEYPSSESVGGPFIFFQMNVVDVWDVSQQAWRVFYHDPTRSFFAAHFVQNGERILVGASDAEENTSWLLLDRDGTLVDEVALPRSDSTALHRLTMTPDGFLITDAACSQSVCSSTTIFEYNTRDGLDLKARRVIKLDGNNTIIWLQPTEPLPGEYVDWQFFPPAQP